jgi:hypothetical protein
MVLRLRNFGTLPPSYVAWYLGTKLKTKEAMFRFKHKNIILLIFFLVLNCIAESPVKT